MQFDDYQLGETDELIRVDERDENTACALSLIEQCRFTIDIVSRDLDPLVLDKLEVEDAMRQHCLKGRNRVIRILVVDAQSIARKGHRLLELSKRLSSFMEVRKLHRDHESINECFLLADETGYLYRENAAVYHARVNFNDRRQSKQLAGRFSDMWNSSIDDPNLRRVGL